MLRDITLGQYYPVDSVLHRLDPRTKLFGTLVYIISLFAAGGAAAYGLAAVFLATAIRLSRVPVKFIVRGLKSILILLLISVSFNLFLTPGTPIFQIGFLKMTWEGVQFAAFMALRLTGCTVYVTLEPCLMCAGLMVNARVDRCAYGAADPKGGALGTLYDVSCDPRLNHAFEVTPGVLADEAAERLRSFFRARRRR